MKYYSFMMTEKSFSYYAFYTEVEMRKFLGIDNNDNVIDTLTIFETQRIILNRIDEKIILDEYGLLTDEKLNTIISLLKENFNQEIERVTIRNNGFSDEFLDATNRRK